MTSTNIIKSLGVSEIDTKELVTNLVDAAKAPRQKIIDVEKKKVDFAISNTALLKNVLGTLQGAATELGGVGKLNQMTITSSDTAVVTASKSAVGVAKAGSYSFKVKALAAPQRTVIDFPSNFKLAHDGQITLSRGTSEPPDEEVVISLDEGASPQQIVDAVNAQAAAFGIRATTIGTNKPGTPIALVLESDSGLANGFASKFDWSSIDLIDTANEITFRDVTAASNAVLEINGVELERESNTITDAISGLTLQVNSSSDTKTVQLRIAADSSGAVEKVKNFVEAFNLVRDFLVRATGPQIAGDDIAGSLQNDSAARGILVKLRAAVTSEFTAKPSSITHWSVVGVAFDRTGALTLDESKFIAAFEGNSEDLITALTNNGAVPSLSGARPSGLAGDIAVLSYRLTTEGGILESMSRGYDAGKTRVEKRQTDLDRYIERMREQYDKQFSALNATLARFKDAQSQLTRAFASSEE
jgi:flagellar hook-associated protein 2